MVSTRKSSCHQIRRKICLNKELRPLERDREKSPKKKKKDLPRKEKKQRKLKDRLNLKEEKPKL